MREYVDALDAIRAHAADIATQVREAGGGVSAAAAIAANGNPARLREQVGEEWAPDVDRLLLREVEARLSPLYQGPKKRNARRIQICPESEEQRQRWEAKAKAANLSLSAWLVRAAERAGA